MTDRVRELTDQVRISVVVQHHPARAPRLERLLVELSGPHTLGSVPQVAVDPEPEGPPDCWRSYRAALVSAPARASHVLVVQDDILPAPGFVEGAARAVGVRPDAPVAFYVGRNHQQGVLAQQVAKSHGYRFALVDPGTWIPVQAVAWPVDDAQAAVAWVDEHGHRDGRMPWQERRPPARAPNDDELLARWLRSQGRMLLVTVPSLVDHDDDAPTLLPATSRSRFGGQARRAVYLADDAAGIEWGDGFTLREGLRPWRPPALGARRPTVAKQD